MHLDLAGGGNGHGARLNKYGIDDSAALDSDESATSLLVQYHFH
ncbi:hypothetical protein [Endothiovibrio diazotrophicus]